MKDNISEIIEKVFESHESYKMHARIYLEAAINNKTDSIAN